jgi:succinate dehydrogenase / fumarate reductase, cytochrome b subunit
MTGRPVFLDPLRIRLPVGALTSIAHRISGLLLAIGIPGALYVLELSLRDPVSHERAVGLFGHGLFKIAVIVFVWALAHHLLAGVRHLLSDVDVGSQLRQARRSAWLVNLGGVAVALLAAAAVA